MIRINLLGGEQKAKTAAVRFDGSHQVAAMCVAVIVAFVAGIGFWYWSLSHEANSLAAQVTALTREVDRLDIVLAEVKTFEERRSTLQQRVALIERLRQGQTVPVQLLDHVSRSLPEMLWLSDLKQEGEFLTIEGRTTTLIGLSDFVGNLGSNPVLQKPIEIMDSTAEAETAAKGESVAPELIRFKVRAALNGLPKPEEEAGKSAKKKGKK